MTNQVELGSVELEKAVIGYSGNVYNKFGGYVTVTWGLTRHSAARRAKRVLNRILKRKSKRIRVTF